MLKSIEIRINGNCKIKKENTDLQKAIYRGIDNIAKFVLEFEQQGIIFNKIFNCDALKYDKYENGLYAYRHHDKSRTQLRLLYRVIENTDKIAIELVSFYVKRNINSDYISYFSKLSQEFKNNSNYQVLKAIS